MASFKPSISLSLSPLSLSLLPPKDDREITDFLLCHWGLSATGLLPAKPKDSVASQRGDAQCSHPEMGIFLGRAFSGSSFPTLLLLQSFLFGGLVFILTFTHLLGSFTLFII